MNTKFIVRKSQKTILSLNIKLSKDSILGELDIMMDSAKEIPFDKVVAGDYYQKFDGTIHAISWHGYYQNDTNNKINGNQNSNYSELEGEYSLLVHDPNDAFNRMANRFIITYDEERNEITDIGIIKDNLNYSQISYEFSK